MYATDQVKIAPEDCVVIACFDCRGYSTVNIINNFDKVFVEFVLRLGEQNKQIERYLCNSKSAPITGDYEE